MSEANGFAATGAGIGSALLGDMQNLSAGEWLLLSMIVISSVSAGALARQGQVEQRQGVTREQILQERRWAVMVLSAQFLFGMVVSAQASGNIWVAIPACLAIGWTGNTFLQWLAKRSGIGD